MKKIILTGVSLLFAVTMTFAQQSDAEVKAKATVETLTEKLTLSEEQQAAIYPIIYEKQQTKLMLIADTALSQEEVKERMQQAGADANSKILEVLTDEQKAAFHELIGEAKKSEEK